MAPHSWKSGESQLGFSFTQAEARLWTINSFLLPWEGMFLTSEEDTRMTRERTHKLGAGLSKLRAAKGQRLTHKQRKAMLSSSVYFLFSQTITPTECHLCCIQCSGLRERGW